MLGKAWSVSHSSAYRYIDRCLGKEKFLFLPVRYKMSNFLSNCQGI
ncbi:MAG: hypothetical protein IM477_21335 [Microcystis sp. M090S1]|nr:hypothetical protein [Microcystis sp. M090S1]